MKWLIISVLVFNGICCKPEREPCDLEYLDGFSFMGDVNYCNAMAGQQVLFDARATLKLLDSAFMVTIISIDTIMPDFSFTDTALVECLYGEAINYRLNPLSGHGENIGFLSSDGDVLLWKIFLDPCFDSTFFNGFKE